MDQDREVVDIARIMNDVFRLGLGGPQGPSSRLKQQHLDFISMMRQNDSTADAANIIATGATSDIPVSNDWSWLKLTSKVVASVNPDAAAAHDGADDDNDDDDGEGYDSDDQPAAMRTRHNGLYDDVDHLQGSSTSDVSTEPCAGLGDEQNALFLKVVNWCSENSLYKAEMLRDPSSERVKRPHQMLINIQGGPGQSYIHS
jgi:hypothetical protein